MSLRSSMNSIPSNRVLISGGSGFVGYWMGKTNPKDTLSMLVSSKGYQDTWEGYDFTHIVHLAPVSPARVLKYAKEHGTRVLFASSGAIYNGRNQYAYHKRLWEAECVHSNVDVVIVRLFTFIGARLKNLYAITRFIEAAKAGKPLEVWGDGSTVRSYLYGSDLGNWMWKLLLEGEGVYDVGSATPYSIREVARLVADVIPAKIQYVNVHAPVTCYLPDISRARELGCEETVNLREAIERVINEK